MEMAEVPEVAEAGAGSLRFQAEVEEEEEVNMEAPGQAAGCISPHQQLLQPPLEVPHLKRYRQESLVGGPDLGVEAFWRHIQRPDIFCWWPRRRRRRRTRLIVHDTSNHPGEVF